jgi:hypothetical protein
VLTLIILNNVSLQFSAIKLDLEKASIRIYLFYKRMEIKYSLHERAKNSFKRGAIFSQLDLIVVINVFLKIFMTSCQDY